MLLYSNTLLIRDTLKQDEFIALAIEWDQNGNKNEGIIRNIKWNGEHSVRFGTGPVWMGIEEYGGEIIAIRYEKIDPDNSIWRTDLVMDFAERELTMCLNREEPDSSLEQRKRFIITPPILPRILIDRHYVRDDGILPVLYEPILIQESNVRVLADIINRRQMYRLPVIYISLTNQGEVPVRVEDLAYLLKGAAHVFVQESTILNGMIRAQSHGQNEYFGAVGIYFPDGRHYRFFHKSEFCPDRELFKQVFSNVIRYWRELPLPPLRTWDEVKQAIHDEQLSDLDQDMFDSMEADEIMSVSEPEMQSEFIGEEEASDFEAVDGEPEMFGQQEKKSLRSRIRAILSEKS